MSIQRSGATPSTTGDAARFTGSVRIDSPFQAPSPGRAGGSIVTFEPRARTAWHTHPLGQILIVTSGVGWTQCDGEPVEEIRAGDVVTCPPDTRHWHGATSTSAMTHVAIVESLDGKNVEWMEPVTDADYLAREART